MRVCCKKGRSLNFIQRKTLLFSIQEALTGDMRFPDAYFNPNSAQFSNCAGT